MSELQQIKEKVLKACRWMEEKGLVFGTWGNISVKYKDSFIITPSKIGYDVMTPDDMVIINLRGEKIVGNKVPSSEKELHRLIHINRDDILAVVHNHSTLATAIACTGQCIPAIDEEMSQVIGGRIECTSRYIPAGRHLELAEEAVRCLGNRNAVLLRNHGVVCCGRDLEEALIACLIAEKSAQIYINLNRDLKPLAIPDVLVEEERYRFIHKYGKEN